MVKKINLAPTSPMNFVLSEKIDVDPGHRLLALAKYVPDLLDLPASGLKKYLDHAECYDGEVRVKYTDTGIGRLEISPVDHHGGEELTMTCQAQLWNYTKAACCVGIYKDMDIQNAHPVLVVQMCEQYGLPCEHLKRYNESRSALIAESGLTKSQFKSLFFSAVLYHPQCTDRELASKLEKVGLKSEPPIFAQLRAEISAASKHLLSLYQCYMEKAVEVKGKDYFNLPGTAFSYLVQTAEKRCILALKDYWDKQDVEVGALIHDGMHVDIEQATPDHLRKGSAHIRDKTGYKVTLEYKEFEPHPAYETMCIGADMEEIVEHAHRLIAGRLVKCRGRVWFRDPSFQWHSGDNKEVLALVAKAVSEMHIFGPNMCSLSRNVTVQEGIGHKHMIARELVDTAPVDNTWVDRVRKENVGRLCFLDGYWDFAKREFVAEQVDTLARVEMLFPARDEAAMAELEQKVVVPILGPLRDSMLSWLSRGLAGMVVDKSFGVWLGERDSGKSALIGLNENTFGSQLVATLNAETFMIKQFQDQDTSKQLGFMLQCEHARLIFTNECEIDPTKPQALSGALLKKFCSGGDSITARLLHRNPVTFRMSGRLMMAANDMPDIAPSDACEKLDYFQSPSVFVHEGDPRIGNPHVFKKDEGIKDYCAQPEVMAAWVHTVLDMYSDSAVRTPQMDMMRDEFTNGADDKERFLELFQLTGSKDDLLTVGEIKREVSQARLAVTSRRYNRWIKSTPSRLESRAISQGEIRG